MAKEIIPTKHTAKNNYKASSELKVSIAQDVEFSQQADESFVPKVTPQELGRKGEEAAVRFLEHKGFEILEQNWTCFAGEADIIALDGSTVCFIEVKTRRGVRKGFPSEAVDAKKRARYEKIAACYLQDYGKSDVFVRFDIISILVLGPSHAFLRMHTNAFCFDN